MYWGQITDNKIWKDQKTPTAASEELGARTGYCACLLHTTQSKRWASHPSHPSGSTPGHTSTLTPCKEQGCPLPWGVGKGAWGLFSLPTTAAGTLTKPCLNILSDLWSISIDEGGQESWWATYSHLCLLDGHLELSINYRSASSSCNLSFLITVGRGLSFLGPQPGSHPRPCFFFHSTSNLSITHVVFLIRTGMRPLSLLVLYSVPNPAINI